MLYLTVLRRVEVTGSGVTRLLEREIPGPSSAPCSAPCRWSWHTVQGRTG